MTKPFEGTIKNIKKAMPGMMNEMLLTAQRHILIRIEKSGTDAKGQSMGSYSPAYREKRKKAGRKVGRVNLRFTSEMLNDLKPISISSDGRKGILGFTLQEAKNKAKYTTQRYGTWLGLPKRDQKKLTKVLSRELRKVVVKQRKTVI